MEALRCNGALLNPVISTLNEFQVEVINHVAKILCQINDKNFNSKESIFFQNPGSFISACDSKDLHRIYPDLKDRAFIVALRCIYFLVYKYQEIDVNLFAQWVDDEKINILILVNAEMQEIPINTKMQGIIADNVTIPKNDNTISGLKRK